MSDKFPDVKEYYGDGNGLWGKKRVRNAVVKGWITAEEYKQITGEEYAPEGVQ